MPFTRGKEHWQYIRIPKEGGGYAVRACHTTDVEFATDVENACRTLSRRREWRVLAGVLAGTVTLDMVRDAYARDKLAALTEMVDDVDLAPHVMEWFRALVLRFGNTPKPGQRAHRTTPEHYLREVRRLIPEGAAFPRSRFSVQTLRAYLADRPGKPATKVRAKAALSSFANHLVDERVLAANPLRSVPTPKVQVPDPIYLALHESDRLIAACQDVAGFPMRTLETLIHATGMELMALRLLTRADFDLKRMRVRARGTKREQRDRFADIDPWAIPALRDFLAATAKGAKPSDRPFAFLTDEKGAGRALVAHQAALRAAGLRDDYTLHMARHSWAVRYVAAGVPLEAVARQLGHHGTASVSEVYGRFRPTGTDVARYQALAAARDAELRAHAESPVEDEPDAASNATYPTDDAGTDSQILVHSGAERRPT